MTSLATALSRVSLNCGKTTCLVRSSAAAFHSSAALEKNKHAGIPKYTTQNATPKTYEEMTKPHHIGARKMWNSWHTGNLRGEAEHSRRLVWEDAIIRSFIKGTFHIKNLVSSPIIIKRQANLVRITFLVDWACFGWNFQYVTLPRISFLVGYTEEMLQHILRCPVKLEIQSIRSQSDTTFRFI